MLQSYNDIRDEMTRLLRRSHFWIFNSNDDGQEGKAADCSTFSYDVVDVRTERCCSCVATPTWHDQNGVPRFAPHHPTLCPDIYATEVVLLRISCQACHEQFNVQMSWDKSGAILGRAKIMALAGVQPHITEDDIQKDSLANQVRCGIIHYGDPPHHDCATGVTMNCNDLRVLEFWSRNYPSTGSREWQRIAELEIELPDASDPDARRP